LWINKTGFISMFQHLYSQSHRSQLWHRYDRLYNFLNQRRAIVLFDTGELITAATKDEVMQGSFADLSGRGWQNLGNPATSAEARAFDVLERWGVWSI
jgi:hypothetical protein